MFNKFREVSTSNFAEKYAVGIHIRDRIAREMLSYDLKYVDVIDELKVRYSIEITEAELEGYLRGYGSFTRNLDYYLTDLFSLDITAFPEGYFYKTSDSSVKSHILSKFLNINTTFTNIIKTYIK